MKNWNKLVDGILTNTDNGSVKDVVPIDNEDKNNIVQLDETEALMVWNTYFSETTKNALLFECTCGEPIMTEIFDESKVDAGTLKKTLRSMYSDETPILLYWNMNTAVKTTWKIFVKYWDNFFYSAGDEAIIYVNSQDSYIYTDMIVRKINKIEKTSEVSAFDYLQKLGDEKEKKLRAFENLFDGVSSDLQDELYLLFHQISEGLRVLETEELRKEYLDYCNVKISTNTQNLILACKPPSAVSKNDYYNSLEDCWGELTDEKFHEFLKRIIEKQIN